MVTCAAFIAPDMNKAHVITPAVDSDVAPESAEKRAPKRGGWQTTDTHGETNLNWLHWDSPCLPEVLLEAKHLSDNDIRDGVPLLL